MKIFKYVIFVIYFWCLFSIKSFAITEIILNPSISRPSYLFSSSSVRDLPQMTIYLYYIEPGELPELFSIVSYRNGSFWPNSVAVPISDLRYTKFVTIFSLSNSTTKINSFISFPENLSDSADEITKARRILLKIDLNSNTLIFPSITKESHPILFLALHSYYVLTHYLESPPIQPYSSSDGRSIPVNVVTEYSKKTVDGGAVSRCHYNPDRKDINVSTKWECSSYDSTYKHEYGHHLTYSVFKIPYTKYNPKYELFEACDEQTALNEGFSVFLSSRGTFNGLYDDFHNYFSINAGNDGTNLYEKHKTDIRSSLLLRSGESVIGNISIALMQIDPTKNDSETKRIIGYYKNLSNASEKQLNFKSIWDQLSSNDKLKGTSVADDFGFKLNYKELLEELGIVYCRGTIVKFSKENPDESGFRWGNVKYENELKPLEIPATKREKNKIPIFPSAFSVNVTSATNEILRRETLNQISALKTQGDNTPVSSEMETASDFSVELLKIDDKAISDSIVNSDIYAGGSYSNNSALSAFYNKYWISNNWKQIKIDNSKSEIIKTESGVYALRVKAKNKEGLEDSFLPRLDKPERMMGNLIQSLTLFFFEIKAEPKLNIKKMSLGPLHYETFEYEGLYSGRNRHLDKSTSSYIRLNPKILNAWGDEISSPYQRDLKDRCINDIPARYPDCRKDYMTYYLGGYKPTYFLNRDLSLKAKFYAELESDISLKEFTPEEIREFIRLELKTRNPHKPGAVHEELDVTSYCNIEIDNENSKIVKLTIKPINIIKSMNGYQSLLLETTNGKQGDDRQVYSGKSLFYFKDTSGPIVTGTEQDPISGRIHYLLTDFDSGWNSNHLQTIVSVADFENYYDVAMNNGTVPNESEFIFDKELPLGEPNKLGAVKDIELVKDESAINGISLNGSWCSLPADYICKDHSYGIILL